MFFYLKDCNGSQQRQIKIVRSRHWVMVYSNCDYMYMILPLPGIHTGFFCRWDMTKINSTIAYFWGFLVCDIVLIKRKPILLVQA